MCDAGLLKSLGHWWQRRCIFGTREVSSRWTYR